MAISAVVLTTGNAEKEAKEVHFLVGYHIIAFSSGCKHLGLWKKKKTDRDYLLILPLLWSAQDWL